MTEIIKNVRGLLARLVGRSFLPAIAMFILATVLFCLPGNELPDSDWLGEINIDKFVHVGLFAALVVLWVLPFAARQMDKADEKARIRRIIMIVVLMSVAYGIAIEFIQGAFIPMRSYSLADMVADALGSVIGGAFVKGKRGMAG